MYKNLEIIKEKSLVSILMLTHNNFEKVKKCLNSITKIINLDYIYELIILDNNSSEETKNFLKDFSKINKKINLFMSKENLGCAGGRKLLMEFAKGNIILLLDSDVIINSDDFVEKMLSCLGSPNIGIVGFHGLVLDKEKMEFVNMPDDYKGKVDFVSGFCQLFKKNILKKCKIDTFYNPYFAEDADFCYQIKKNFGLSSYALSMKSSGIIHEWSRTNIGDYEDRLKKLRYLFKKFKIYKQTTYMKKSIFLLLDNYIGRIGLVIKKVSPNSYQMFKNIKSKI